MLYAELNNKKIVKLYKKKFDNEFYDYCYMLYIFEKHAILPIMKEVDVNLKFNIYCENIDFEYRIKKIIKIVSKLRKFTWL